MSPMNNSRQIISTAIKAKGQAPPGGYMPGGNWQMRPRPPNIPGRIPSRMCVDQVMFSQQPGMMNQGFPGQSQGTALSQLSFFWRRFNYTNCFLYVYLYYWLDLWTYCWTITIIIIIITNMQSHTEMWIWDTEISFIRQANEIVYITRIMSCLHNAQSVIIANEILP